MQCGGSVPDSLVHYQPFAYPVQSAGLSKKAVLGLYITIAEGDFRCEAYAEKVVSGNAVNCHAPKYTTVTAHCISCNWESFWAFQVDPRQP
jgi:hypothetical protein